MCTAMHGSQQVLPTPPEVSPAGPLKEGRASAGEGKGYLIVSC